MSEYIKSVDSYTANRVKPGDSRGSKLAARRTSTLSVDRKYNVCWQFVTKRATAAAICFAEWENIESQLTEAKNKHLRRCVPLRWKEATSASYNLPFLSKDTSPSGQYLNYMEGIQQSRGIVIGHWHGFFLGSCTDFGSEFSSGPSNAVYTQKKAQE